MCSRTWAIFDSAGKSYAFPAERNPEQVSGCVSPPVFRCWASSHCWGARFCRRRKSAGRDREVVLSYGCGNGGMVAIPRCWQVRGGLMAIIIMWSA